MVQPSQYSGYILQGNLSYFCTYTGSLFLFLFILKKLKAYGRSFQCLLNAGIKTDSHFQQLRLSCSGWIAQYELQSIDGKGGITKSLRIPLQEDDILLHLTQSLRRLDHYLDGTERWELLFPITIAPDPILICILRKVYVLNFSSKGASYMHHTLQLDFHDHLKRKWCILERSKLWSLQTIDCYKYTMDHVYEYKITFSPNSKYLVFCDNSSMSDSTVSVFEFDRDTPTSRLMHFSTMTGNIGGGIRPCEFHPILPVLVFSNASRTCHIWDFVRCKPSTSKQCRGIILITDAIDQQSRDSA